MRHWFRVPFTLGTILLLGLLPVTVEATTYEIKHFTQIRDAANPATTTFSDPFDSGGPPPEGPAGASSYDTFGTFLSGDESGGVLKLVPGQGALGLHDRVLGAAVDFSSFFFTSGVAGSVEGLFRNLEPLPEEGYGIFIKKRLSGPADEAFLSVVNEDGSLSVIFEDEGNTTLGTFDLTGLLTETGEIGLRLVVSVVMNASVVTAFVDPDGSVGPAVFQQLSGSTTLQAMGTDTHTGGFEAFEPVPEAGTLLLLGSGLLGGAVWARGRRKRSRTDG